LDCWGQTELARPQHLVSFREVPMRHQVRSWSEGLTSLNLGLLRIRLSLLFLSILVGLVFILHLGEAHIGILPSVRHIMVAADAKGTPFILL